MGVDFCDLALPVLELTEANPEQKSDNHTNAEICSSWCLPSSKVFIISNTELHPYVWTTWAEKVNAQKTIPTDTMIKVFSISVYWGASTLLASIEQSFYPAVWKGWCLNKEWCEPWTQGKLAGVFCCWNFWCLTSRQFWLKYCLLSGKNLSVTLPSLASEVPP